jgi:DNA-binding transcriptional MerR regulator
MTIFDELLLTVADVARRTGLTPETIRTHDHDLRPSRTPSGVRVYYARAVDAWLAERAAKLAKIDAKAKRAAKAEVTP